MSAMHTTTTLINRCKACAKEISVDEEYLHDGESLVHVQCYLCSHCHTSLAGHFYYRYKDPRGQAKKSLYCEACYYRLAPVCFHCLKTIEDISLTYGERIFHPNCFVCARCQKPFQGQLVYPYENHAYCAKCYPHVQRQFRPAPLAVSALRCSICRKKFEPGDMVTQHHIEVPSSRRDQSSPAVLHIHNSCFVCELCHANLSDAVYYSPNAPDEDPQQMRFYCQKCHATSATICSSCFKPSDNLMIVFNDRWYHDQCFKCKHCSYSLRDLTRIIIEPDGLLCERCLKVIRDQQEQQQL